VDWRPAQGDYFCVCHSSTWTRDAQLAVGPAKRGLDPLEARLTTTGEVEVKYATFALDTSERVEEG
jgi:Rieske Fe-S protein